MSKIIIVAGGKGTGKTTLLKQLGATPETTTPLSKIDKKITEVINYKLNDEDTEKTEFIEVKDQYTISLNGLAEHPNLTILITLGVKENREVVHLNFFELPF